MLDKPRILSLSPTRLINSIKHEHSCKILYLLSLLLSVGVLCLFLVCCAVFSVLSSFAIILLGK